jgi:hypothetical protein
VTSSPSAGLEERVLGVSWSRLREHEECSMKGALKEQGKRSKISNIRTYFPGTVVDRCMRQWLDTPDHPEGWMVAQAEAILAAEEVIAQETGDGVVRWKSPSDKAETIDWCRELLSRLEPILRQHVLPYSYLPALRFREPLIATYLDGTPQQIWLVGELDLLVYVGMGTPDFMYRIYDLKGTSNPDYWRKTVAQLTFYGLAMLARFGKLPQQTGLIQPMCDEACLPFDFAAQNYAELGARVQKYCRDVWAGEFAPKVSDSGCGEWCEVGHACPKFPRAPGWFGWPSLPVAVA